MCNNILEASAILVYRIKEVACSDTLVSLYHNTWFTSHKTYLCFQYHDNLKCHILYLGFDCCIFSIHQTVWLAPIGSARTTWPLELGRETWKITCLMAVFNIMWQVGARRCLEYYILSTILPWYVKYYSDPNVCYPDTSHGVHYFVTVVSMIFIKAVTVCDKCVNV